MASLDARLEAAAAAGLISSGPAHRAGLAAQLLASLGGEGLEGAAPAVSGRRLAGARGLSRAAVQKHIQHLQALGFALSSVRGAGYRLDKPFTDLVAAEAVLPFLLGASEWQDGRGDGSTMIREHAVATASGERRSFPDLPGVGLPYLYLGRCESTNLVLRHALASQEPREQRADDPVGPLPGGAVVVSDAQTRGRGRLNRSWASLSGLDLTFSVLLRPDLAPAEAQLLSLAAGLAVAEVLETLPGMCGLVAVKWPNDVLLDDKKVCGVLLEGSMDADRLRWAIAGIGLNVNSSGAALLASANSEEAVAWERRPSPISLRDYQGRVVPRAPLLASLLHRLGRRWGALEAGPAARREVLEQLRNRDALAGRRVEISRVGASRAVSGARSRSPGNGAAAWAAARGEEPVLTGVASGLGLEGQLLIRLESGDVVEVLAGDVRVTDIGPRRPDGAPIL